MNSEVLLSKHPTAVNGSVPHCCKRMQYLQLGAPLLRAQEAKTKTGLSWRI